jgi:hypothetical protein
MFLVIIILYTYFATFRPITYIWYLKPETNSLNKANNVIYLYIWYSRRFLFKKHLSQNLISIWYTFWSKNIHKIVSILTDNGADVHLYTFYYFDYTFVSDNLDNLLHFPQQILWNVIIVDDRSLSESYLEYSGFWVKR